MLKYIHHHCFVQKIKKRFLFLNSKRMAAMSMYSIQLHRVIYMQSIKLIKLGHRNQMISSHMLTVVMHIGLVILHHDQLLNIMNAIQIIFYKLQNNLMHLRIFKQEMLFLT